MSKQDNDKLVYPPEFDMTPFEELEELSNRVNERVRNLPSMEELRLPGVEEPREESEKDGLL